MPTVDVGDVLRRVFQIYGAQFGTLFGLALIVSLVSALILLLLIGAGAGAGGVILGLVVTLVLSTLYTGVVVKLVQDLEDGRRDATMGELVAAAVPIVVPLLGVSLLYAIGIVVGLFLLIVPGLLLMTIWAVAVPVVVVERRGVVESLGRSRELVRGNGWPVFGAIVVVLLITLVANMVAGAVAGSSDVGFFLANWILPALIAPITALVAAVLYFALVPREAAWEAPSAPQGLGG